MNIYQRRDGRFERRISRGKRSDGTRKFSVRQRKMSVRKWRKNAVKRAIPSHSFSTSGIRASNTRSRNLRRRITTIESKQQAGLSNSYISDMLIVMKSMFKYAFRIYHIYNPMECIKMPRAKMPEITLLDEKEQTKLQEYISDNQNKATLGVALSMTTGIRIGELWQDIDLEKRILTVSKTIQRVQI